MDCIFCKIINGDIPSYKIYEDDNVLAFLDINPTSPGHTLIIPKEHTLDLISIDKVLLVDIFDVAKIISTTLTEKLGAVGFTIVQNNGIAQDVKHFHLHVIPKYNKKFTLDIETVYEKIVN